MRRFFNPAILILTAIILCGYGYAALRLAPNLFTAVVLGLPFLFVWIVPVVYWMAEREGGGWLDNALHMASYLSMGWLSFLMLFLVARDATLLIAGFVNATAIKNILDNGYGDAFVWVGSFIALGLGLITATRGPSVHTIDINVDNLPPELDGLRIVQITDLHVGPTIRRPYVERVVRMTQDLTPDLIALTGDMVDGSVEELKQHVAPLGDLSRIAPAFLALGNHDYYSGAPAWTRHFESLGLKTLLNAHTYVAHRGTEFLVAGVLDPTAKIIDPLLKPDPAAAMRQQTKDTQKNLEPGFRLLLAHNPKIAPEGARAGFDLQLSGHTHAGQFVPWTIVTRFVHDPHYAGLSRQDNMWVYVSAGTGTWGPPIRLGTKPELTLIRLHRHSG